MLFFCGHVLIMFSRSVARYLKNRRYNSSLKNVAVWGYWRGVGMYGGGTYRENAPFFEALSGTQKFLIFGSVFDNFS